MGHWNVFFGTPDMKSRCLQNEQHPGSKTRYHLTYFNMLNQHPQQQHQRQNQQGPQQLPHQRQHLPSTSSNSSKSPRQLQY